MGQVIHKSNLIFPKCIFHEESLDQITLQMVINSDLLVLLASTYSEILYFALNTFMVTWKSKLI